MLKRFDIVGRAVLPTDSHDAHILVYTNPDQAEKQLIIDMLDIDQHTIDSALDPDEISRLEHSGELMSLIFKRPKNYSSAEQFVFKVASSGIFLYKKQMVIVMSDDIPVFGEKMFSDVGSMQEVLLRILYRSVYHFLEHLKVINMISNEIEKNITDSMENKYLLHMFSLSKSLIYYLNAINTNSAAIEKLRNMANKFGFSTEEMELLDDIHIENGQCYKQAEIYSGILTGLMDARGSIVNNNLNILMKRLTVINIVFMPLNLLAGIGGMSEWSAVTEEIGMKRLLSYPVFMVGMIVIGVLTYYIIERLGTQKQFRIPFLTRK